ncbi:hypothetical protein C0583_00200 [Candidatus Parcubacteria bacterium]|nr:MAG: hypothetical protein C0583_00200 [Candidatus Parcubacteria bacterium]
MSISKIRSILGSEGKSLSDEDIKSLHYVLEGCADVIFDKWVEKKKNNNSTKLIKITLFVTINLNPTSIIHEDLF